MHSINNTLENLKKNKCFLVFVRGDILLKIKNKKNERWNLYNPLRISFIKNYRKWFFYILFPISFFISSAVHKITILTRDRSSFDRSSSVIISIKTSNL